MDARPGTDRAVAAIAAAMGEPARARMLFSLLDDRARTGTELAALAEVGASTASAHLRRLQTAGLVTVARQGRHRYFRLRGAEVAAALETLSALSTGAASAAPFAPTAPPGMRAARSCYDHLAGTLGVAWHDRLLALGWMTAARDTDYALTERGREGLAELGVDVAALQRQHRRFVFGCLDWSERRAHLGGALGAALLATALRRRWLERELDSRALRITPAGRREFARRFGMADAWASHRAGVVSPTLRERSALG